MYKLLMLAALLILPCGMARADTGNDLLRHCQDDETNYFSSGMCLGYVSGAIDALLANMYAQKTCWFELPGESTNKQLVDVTVKYLTDHPEQRQYLASVLVMVAMREAFPCPK
jgi:hypothetical protein